MNKYHGSGKLQWRAMTTELKMWNGKQYTEGYLTRSQPVYSKSAISLKTLKEKKKILYVTLPTIMQIGNAVLHFFSSQLQKRKLRYYPFTTDK